MTKSSARTAQIAVLVFASVAFGMVLAGGLGLTVPGLADDEAGPQVVAPGSAVAGLPSFADLAEAVEPAVISIRADTFQSSAPRQMLDPFEFFFGPRREQGAPGPEEEGEQGPPGQGFREESGGSGFVISPDGLIATNNHVVQGADRLVVLLEGREYPAEVKGTDPETDLALIQIDAGRKLRYLRLGDSERLRVGDWIMAIGSPLSLEHTVTVGVVSAKGRSLQVLDPSFENFIQTDAAINFGNSGGPLVNMAGEVVGIATLINFGAENIGFAVPVNTLKSILPQLRDEGRVTRGYLGVEISNLDYERARAFGLESTDGALVGTVREGQPAAEAGLRHGDIVLRVDAVEVEETRDLIDYVSAKRPGDTVELEVWRDGQRVELEVELGERPGAEAVAEEPARPDSSGIDWLGLRYRELSAELRQSHGLPASARGVWVTSVAPNSPLYDEGLAPGDIIAEVNGQPVDGGEAFETAVENLSAGAYVRFYVQRFDPRNDRWTSFFAVARKP
ncbi:MAG TPA: Do family serine endopeptidase [Thermoanaerobaculia bacterium]|nr:Do family serine endopeptidase [Thermoanaerobaculia bacterium]